MVEAGGGLLQAVEVAVPVGDAIVARRDEAERCGCMAFLAPHRYGKTMGEAVDDAVEGEETFTLGLAHLGDEGLRLEPFAVRQAKILRRNEVQDFLIRQVCDE